MFPDTNTVIIMALVGRIEHDELLLCMSVCTSVSRPLFVETSALRVPPVPL